MERKYQYVVLVDDNPSQSGIFSDKETAVRHFKDWIEEAVSEVGDSCDLEEVSEDLLKGNYFPSDDFEKAVENYLGWDFGEDSLSVFDGDGPQMGWKWTYDTTDWEAESPAYGCHFSLFFNDSPYRQFHRKWFISLLCIPVFESKDECEQYWRGEYRNDEFLKSQFEGENGVGWTQL